MKQRNSRIDPGLADVIASVGRLQDIADQIGVTVQTVSQWRRVPAERVLQVEHLTGVSRHRQRPDIYGPEPRRLLARRRHEARAA